MNSGRVVFGGGALRCDVMIMMMVMMPIGPEVSTSDARRGHEGEGGGRGKGHHLVQVNFVELRPGGDETRRTHSFLAHVLSVRGATPTTFFAC